jgi:phospholipid transport system substrate-binding protein
MDRRFARCGRRALLALAAAAFLLAPGARHALAAGATADATAVVQDLTEQTWAVLQQEGLDERQRVRQLAAVLSSRTDVRLLSRLALGRNWQRLNAEQQARYEELFGKVVIHGLARRLDTYVNGVSGALDDHFEIVSSQPAGGDDVLVRTTVQPPRGNAVHVDWRLRPAEQGPVIIDLIIEGASLLVAQRSEFASVIERSDVDGLLGELQARAGATGS